MEHCTRTRLFLCCYGQVSLLVPQHLHFGQVYLFTDGCCFSYQNEQVRVCRIQGQISLLCLCHRSLARMALTVSTGLSGNPVLFFKAPHRIYLSEIKLEPVCLLCDLVFCLDMTKYNIRAGICGTFILCYPL